MSHGESRTNARVGGRAVTRVLCVRCIYTRLRSDEKRFSFFSNKRLSCRVSFLFPRIISEKQPVRRKGALSSGYGGSRVSIVRSPRFTHCQEYWLPSFGNLDSSSLYLVTFELHQTNVTDNLLAKLVTKRSTYLPISHFLFLHVK